MKTVTFRALITLVSLAVTLLLSEYYLRQEVTHIVQQELEAQGGLVEANPEFLVQDTGRGRRFVPNAHVVIKNHYLSKRDIPVNINSLGLRGAELPATKGPAEERIMFLGDSVTVSDYLLDEETFPALVAKKLQSIHADKNIVAVNAAIGNIGTEEEVNILEDTAEAVKPDLLVLGFYLNDSRPPWGFSGEIGDRGWLRRHSVLAETIYQQLEQRKWIEKQGIDRFAWIERSLQLPWRTKPEGLVELAHAARFDWGAAWQPQSWDVVEKQFVRLKAQAQKFKVPVLVVAFPVIYQVEAEYLDDTPQRNVRELATKYGFSFVDMLPVLRSHRKQKLFFDHCHLTVTGNEVVSEALVAAIQEKALLP